MADINKSRELTIKVDVDVSEALTGLKAVQRGAKKATQELRAIEFNCGGLVRGGNVIPVGSSLFRDETKDVPTLLAHIPIKIIHEELVRREGVTEYWIDAHGGTATISIDNGNQGDNIVVDGPAKIVVNKD
jgi:hypothetical protein